MLTKLTLKQFRGFRSLETDIRPITVVMGRNSSGKTSVLHAVRMAVEALAIGLEEGAPHLDDDGWITVCSNLIVRDLARLHPVAVTDWAELFTDKQVGEGTTMSASLDFEEPDVIQRLHVELLYARNQQLKMHVRVRSRGASEQVDELPRKSKFRSSTLHEALLRGSPKAIFIPAFYGVTSAEEYRSKAVADRLLGGGDQSRIVRNFVARLSGADLARLNDFLQRSLGARVVDRTTAQQAESVQHLQVIYRDTNGNLELASAGAGLINLIALYSAMEQFRPPSAPAPEQRQPVIYLLDEPEAHLHPKLQGDIGESLGALALEFGAQLVIATHSIEMINRLGQRRDSLLLAVDRATSSVTRLESESALVQELGRWCDLTPFTSLNFLASRRILFHEGPSDAELLTRCAEVYFRSRPVDLAAFKRWTLVSLEGVGNIKAQGVLGSVLTPKLFPDLDKKLSVRAVCVLDRDAERQPGFRPLPKLTKGHFEAYELIWSRYSIESLFLEPACLVAWIASSLPSGATVGLQLLQDLVQAGLAKANKDQELLDEAEKALMMAKLRKDVKLGNAMDEAKQEARADPATWQKGRERARLVLRHVYEGLPNAARGHLRTSLAGLVEAAAIDKHGDTTVLIPEEIRQLLEYMAAPELVQAASAHS